MTLFTDVEPDVPPRTRHATWIGWTLVILGLLAATVLAVSPAPYVIERPGPVFDTLGEVEFQGSEVPLIEIPGEETFPTAGTLSLLTVTISGNPEQLPSWVDIALAWFDPSQKVVPVESVYPDDVSLEESNEQSAVDMENSQREAIAAALSELGYEFSSTLTVVETSPGTPAEGVIEAGDRIVSLNGEVFDDVTALRAGIAENGVDRPAQLVVERAGEQVALEITPELSDPVEGQERAPVLGIVVGGDYDFPVDVSIQLENVGGPSAGMMFALGIIDKLTPGELNGGADVAGTGTIAASGEVGPIGGIRQKMYGAVGSGAEWFLAPAANCDEVVGNVPGGLEVFAVETLGDAEQVLATIAEGGDTGSLTRCEAVVG